MDLDDTQEQLLNVVAGNSADGRPRGAPKMDFPDKQLSFMVSVVILALFRDLGMLIPDEIEKDEVRTAAIIVLLRWLRVTKVTEYRKIKDLMVKVADPPRPPLI